MVDEVGRIVDARSQSVNRTQIILDGEPIDRDCADLLDDVTHIFGCPFDSEVLHHRNR